MTERLAAFTNDGLLFDLRDEGPLDGPVVIALHGFPQTSKSWSGVIPLLTAAGYRVLAPDQRGYSPGARPAEVSSYALDRLVGDVLALADQAGAERFDLLGHDWGAAVSWLVAANHPDRVRSVAALSVPHPVAFVSAGVRQLLRSWYMLLFQVPWIPERLWLLGPVRACVVSLFGVPQGAVEDMAAVLGEPRRARAALHWYRAAARSPSTRALLRKVAVPALFLWSDRDIAVSRRAAELCGRQVTGPYRFEVLAGASHWIPDERPAETAERVLAHLGSAS